MKISIRFIFISIILVSSVFYFVHGIVFSPIPLPDNKSDILPPAILNGEVLDVIHSYPIDGSIKRLKKLNGKMGISHDIYYQGTRVLKAAKKHRVHCSGITFEVFMKACEKAAGADFLLNQISVSNFRDFRRDWYGTDGNQRTLVDALIRRDLGREILDPTKARPGDFIQFWRMIGSGHSAVFLGWKYNEEGQISGVKYWSSDSLNGQEPEARIGPEAHDINPEKIYIVRAYEP